MFSCTVKCTLDDCFLTAWYLPFIPWSPFSCFFINPFILHEQPAWWIISNPLLTPTYYVSSTTEPNIFLSVYILYCSAAYLTTKLLTYSTVMPSSHPHPLSSPCSFQTFAWNPGVLACLKASLQPVDLPNTQTSIQVSPGSSSCPHCPHSLPWPTQFSVNLCCVNFDKITWILFFSFRVIKP